MRRTLVMAMVLFTAAAGTLAAQGRTLDGARSRDSVARLRSDTGTILQRHAAIADSNRRASRTQCPMPVIPPGSAHPDRMPITPPRADHGDSIPTADIACTNPLAHAHR